MIMVIFMKPFKTHRQQIKILRDRGLEVDGAKAMRILERENYYSLINGYKDPFLKRDLQGQIISPDTYIKGANFDEVYFLYSFDRKFRNILIEYLLDFESSIKSKIAYRFSEKYKEPHAYLIIKNYSRSSSDLKTVLNLIATISNTISNKGKSKNQPIGHYLDKHDGVPLWVLVKYLTLGNINYFYSVLKDDLKNEISKDFAENYKREYAQSIHFTADMLKNILKATNFYRNLCAHEERMYSFTLRQLISTQQISRAISIPDHLLSQCKLFTTVSILKLVISKKAHKELVRKITNLFNDYDDEFSSIQFTDIMQSMGFPSDWKSYF